MTIGFIGAGNMGSSIIKGMVSGSFSSRDILVYDIDRVRVEQLQKDCGITAALSAKQVCEKASALILAVKPSTLQDILPALSDALNERKPLIISIVAGKTIEWIQGFVGGGLAIARVMPNIACKVGEGISAFCCNPHVHESGRKTVTDIFETVGRVIELDESLFPAFTAIAGCSPAYTLMYIDTLAQAGVRYGIPKGKAIEIAAQAVAGAARLLQKEAEHPRALADKVCSPGGTTIEGVCALCENGFENAVLAAVRASVEKDKKL